MVQVVAHRGSSASKAEHTLAAYVQAIVEGADALECDVRLTADGHLVCVHDRRIDRTSDGHGLVSTMSLAELNRHDFASWHPGSEEGDPYVLDEDAARVLTLERLLELVVDAGRDVGLAIETKHPTRYGSLVEERTVELLTRFGLARPRSERDARVRVMSFSQLSMRRIRAMAPGLPRVLLMDRVAPHWREGWLPFGTVIAGPSIDIVRRHPGYVSKVQARGGAVHVWTVDEPDDVDRCLAAGVDAIITNRPREVLGHLGRLLDAPRTPSPDRR